MSRSRLAVSIVIASSLLIWGCSFISSNQAPISQFSWNPKYPTVGQEVEFLDESYDDESSVAAWTWTFGDGEFSEDPNPIHTYYGVGTYDVQLEVVDQDGAEASATESIKITSQSNQRPTADFVFENLGDCRWQFDASGASDIDGEIISYHWDFGDGQESVIGPVVTHTYEIPAHCTVQLEVTDDDGATGESERSLHFTCR